MIGPFCMALMAWVLVVGRPDSGTYSSAATTTTTTNAWVVKKIIRPVIDASLCNNDVFTSNQRKDEECFSSDKSQHVPCDSRNLSNPEETQSPISERDIQYVVPRGCYEMIVFISYPTFFSIRSVFQSPIFHPSDDEDHSTGHNSKSSGNSKTQHPSDTSHLEDVVSEIYNIFQRIDHDYHLRRLRIIYPTHDYESMAQLIDVLLTPRLWLTVRKESYPYAFSKQSTIFQSFLSKLSSDYYNNKEKAHSFLSIVLDKYHHDLEGFLRSFAHIQYPSYRSCLDDTGVMISRNLCINPGWAGVLGMYKYQQQHFRFASLAVYVSQSNERDEITAFEGGSGSACHLRNRWHCAFLPSSSCLFPEVPSPARRQLSANIKNNVDDSSNSNINTSTKYNKNSLYFSYFTKIISNQYKSQVRRLTDIGNKKENITTGEVVQFTKYSAIPANFTECRGRDCVLQVPETHFFMTFVYNHSYAVPHESDSIQYFSKLMGSPKTVQQQIWSYILEHRVTDLLAVLKTHNMDISNIWDSQPIWVPKTGRVSAKSPKKENENGKVVESITDLFPGISSPESFNNFKYHLPFAKAPLKKWPGGKNKDFSYDMMELSTLDILFQNGYLLRQNHRYRAYIAHALAHFKEIYFDAPDDTFPIAEDAQITELLLATLQTPNGKSGMDNHVYYPNNNNNNDNNIDNNNSNDKKNYNLNKNSLKMKISNEITASDSPSSQRSNSQKHESGTVSVLPRCIAVQIRRGDRIISEMETNRKEYTQYCRENPEGDYGCRSVPFAFISLLNVTEIAPLLVSPEEIHHLVVSTDDEGWLLEEIERLKQLAPNWKVLFLPAPWLSHFNVTDLTDAWQSNNENMHNDNTLHSSRKHRSKVHSHHHHNLTVTKSDAETQFKKFGRTGLTGGIHFMSSMAMLQQCEAFVGHFDSGVAWLMYAAMCHRHADKVGICPPMFDLRKLSDFHAMYGYQY